MQQRRILRAFLALIAALFGSLAFAAETTTYTYDALGRLTATSASGGPVAGEATTISYDAAGNRSNYAIATGAGGTSFSINDASATEGGVVTFTVTKTGSAAGSVNYATATGTAGSGDFTAILTTQLTFAASDTTKTISVQTTQDSLSESSETFTVTLSGPSAGTTIGTAIGTGTIVDNDSGPTSFAISDASATEGGTMTFTITKTGPAAASVQIYLADISATLSTDYAWGSDWPANGLFNFASGDTTKTVTVDTTNDTTVEANETFSIFLVNPSGATISDNQGIGTIYDNDGAPGPSFSISDATAVTEGGTLTFTVTKTGSGAANVTYATANGTATAGSDYTAKSATVLSFTSAQTSQTVTVSTIDDSTVESAETVIVNLTLPTGGATISDSQGSGTINDNDSAGPVFSISDATAVTEGGTLSYTITKTGSGAASVTYATANGTATAGSDYTAKSATVLNFTSAQTSQTVTVSTIDDVTVEGAETVLVNLTLPTGGATISDSQGSGNINDNDSSTYITLTDVDLNVLPAHTGTYGCTVLGLPETGGHLRYCYLASNPSQVVADVSDGNTATFDPGYRMITPYILEVQQSAYGTGQ